jgi:hypothetical protein
VEIKKVEQPLSDRWTREILLRCSPRELLVVVAAYGALAVAKRMGYRDIETFIKENNISQ